MANLEKTAFLFLMLAVALLRLHGLSWLHKIRARSEPIEASKPARNRIGPQHVAALLLLACGITAYGIVLWWLPRPHLPRPDWIVVLNHTIVVQIILAILAGFLFAHISTFLQATQTPSWGALLIRGAPLAFLFFAGFFPYELRNLVNQITRLETSYFVIEINRQDQKKEVVLSESDRANPSKLAFKRVQYF